MGEEGSQVDGKVPERELFLSDNSVRAAILVMEDGSMPDNLALLILIVLSLEQWSSLAGRAPERSVLEAKK